jgi:hypothetical protein
VGLWQVLFDKLIWHAIGTMRSSASIPGKLECCLSQLLEKSSSKFRDIVKQITNKTISRKILDHQCHLNYAMKQKAKMVNKHGQQYLVNATMQDELNFIKIALSLNSGIKFETTIGHLILCTPTASIVGDSSLLACGGYSIRLKFWWHLSFPKEIVERTLLHLKDNKDEHFISINCLEYFTIIMSYCASLLVFENNDLHPVVLCMTDDTSALNWTLHMGKKVNHQQRFSKILLWPSYWIQRWCEPEVD